MGRAKTASGTARVIPFATELRLILAAHRSQWVELFGEPQPGHFVFACCAPPPTDATKHVTDVKYGWSTLRKAGLSCRLHDLRHTFATRLVENGVPKSTMLAPIGHMSRAMLERYSHTRMAAKRDAVAGLRLHRASENLEAAPPKVPCRNNRRKRSNTQATEMNGGRDRTRTCDYCVRSRRELF